jgi:hypothetical protein
LACAMPWSGRRLVAKTPDGARRLGDALVLGERYSSFRGKARRRVAIGGGHLDPGRGTIQVQQLLHSTRAALGQRPPRKLCIRDLQQAWPPSSRGKVCTAGAGRAEGPAGARRGGQGSGGVHPWTCLVPDDELLKFFPPSARIGVDRTLGANRWRPACPRGIFMRADARDLFGGGGARRRVQSPRCPSDARVVARSAVR